MVTRSLLAVLLFLASAPALLRADLKTQERTQIRFEGALGRMVNLFGGRGARDGIVSSVAVKGNRMLTLSGDTGELVDLTEEKVYTLDLKDKEYTVTTFAEMRKRMQEAMAKAKKDAAAAKPEPEPEKKADEPKKEYEVDFSIKPGNGSRQIAGRNAEEQIATIVVREKGKTLEDAGGMVLESHLWMTPVVPELKELNDFRVKYAQAVYGEMAAQAAQNMTQAMAMYPQMQDAMKRMAEESRKLEGTPISSQMIFQVQAPPGQATQSDQRSSAPPTSVGGVLGGLMRKRGSGDKPAADAAPAVPGRARVVTMTNETLQITPSATDADVALPAGLKQK
jgi:hypothetical protein